MKKTTLLLSLLLGIMTATCFAQECPKATNYYDMQLDNNKIYYLYHSKGDDFDFVPDHRIIERANLVEDYRNIETIENEILTKYAATMSEDFKRYVNSEDKDIVDYQNVKKFIILPQLIVRHQYDGDLWDRDLVVPVVSVSGYGNSYGPKIEVVGSNLFYKHLWLQNYFGGDFSIKKSIRQAFSINKEFRDAIYNKVSDFICELVKALPKDFGKYIVNCLEDIDNDLSEIGKDISCHKYELKSYIYGGEWYHGQEWFYLEKDGQPDEYEVAFSSKGWWLRRIFIDKIPYDEIKSRSAELLTRVKKIDVSENADVLTINKLSKGLLYCIGRNGRFLYSCATSKKYEIDGIQKDIENGKTIFRIFDISTADQEYYEIGLHDKNYTYKFDEEGNLIQINVEYK